MNSENLIKMVNTNIKSNADNINNFKIPGLNEVFSLKMNKIEEQVINFDMRQKENINIFLRDFCSKLEKICGPFSNTQF